MDIFRKAYRQLSDEEKATMDAIKQKAFELYEVIDKASNRESALAKTKLEEAVMWAVKSITG